MEDILVPSVGESVSSGIIATWLKATGDIVQEGEDLFELETDKATMPIPATVSGTLTIIAKEGAEVEIGGKVATIDTSAAGSASAKPDAAPQATEAPKATEQPRAPRASGAATNETLSPAVRKLVTEKGIAVSTLQGSGKAGRITKADVLNHRGNPNNQAKPGVERLQSVKSPDLGELQTRVPMSNLRKRIAANLLYSKQNAAHLTTINEVDMSQIMAMRVRYKEEFEKVHQVRLGFMGFFTKAVQQALIAYPSVNAFLDGTDVIYNNVCNIGVAVSTDVGLVVPVLRDVETMSFADIERKIADLGKRARERKLMPDEFSGGTFTISNGGVFGSMISTPIPNPPQTAILGMHTIQKRPMVINDEITIRPMMYLALSYDHQVIDGKEAISFLVAVKRAVEDPERLLIGL